MGWLSLFLDELSECCLKANSANETFGLTLFPAVSFVQLFLMNSSCLLHGPPGNFLLVREPILKRSLERS